jgi:hypothetical protein
MYLAVGGVILRDEPQRTRRKEGRSLCLVAEGDAGVQWTSGVSI